MIRLNSHVLCVVVLTCFGASASLAQGQTQPQQAPKPAETSTMKMDDVSKWTQKQWNAAKVKWTKEKTLWNECQTQAKAKNLSGHKSWQFLYDCMTK
jgi:serine protease inhibitor ecotin